jgi:serine hydrolase
MPANVLILPGIGNSGPDHWQTRWEGSDPSFRRVVQRDWDHPVREEWVAALDETVDATGLDTILVAHSIGCLVVSHWVAASRRAVKAALLVAPPNPGAPAFPKEASGFIPLPLVRLPFPSIVVASSDDPYGSLAFAERCAQSWGGRLVNAGPEGHMNSASGMGAWADGRALLQALMQIQ